MMRETRMDKASLIYPMFVVEGTGIRSEIPSMPGQYHYSPDLLPAALEEVMDAGANIIVAGSAVFNGNIQENVAKFLEVM